MVTKSIEVTPGGDTIDLRLDVAQVWLYPDQAVPMSLLASEAVINALKHMPGPDAPPEDRWIAVSFHESADRSCVFALTNAVPPSDAPQQQRGIGRRLIRAFATQLDGAVELKNRNDIYELTVTFAASEFAPAPGSY